MKLVRTILHVEGVPEIFIFYCTRCKHAETKVQERASQSGRAIDADGSGRTGGQKPPVFFLGAQENG